MKFVKKTEIKIKHHYVHVSQDIMNQMEFVLNAHINVKNVHQPISVLYVPETEKHYLHVLVNTDNMMTVKPIVKNVVINVKPVMTNGLVLSVPDQTENPHQLVTVHQDIMKTQLT